MTRVGKKTDGELARRKRQRGRRDLDAVEKLLQRKQGGKAVSGSGFGGKKGYSREGAASNQSALRGTGPGGKGD